MIEIKNVSKSYTKDKKAVDDLSLTIQNGEIFGFLGPNGAGKTTTLHMITGVLDADQGSIAIDGHDIEKDAIAAKRAFGFVPDSPDFFLSLKGIEYLNFMADVYGVQNRETKIQKYTELFGIRDVLKSPMQSYSHGMRQKAILCGALLHDPKNWILDEPLTGLDPKSAYDLKEMMRSHAQAGNSVLFSTHVLEVAEKLCDRVGIIRSGKLVFVGSLAELKSFKQEDDSLEKLFLEMTND